MNKKTQEGFHDELEKLGMDPVLAGILAGGVLGGGIGMLGSHTLADFILKNKNYMAGFGVAAGAGAGGLLGFIRASKLYDHGDGPPQEPRLGQEGVYGRGPA